MKNLLPILFGTLSLPLGALSPGEDLAAFWKAQEGRYRASRPLAALPGWPGYETAVLATDSQFSRPPFVVVLRATSGAVVIPFGTVEGPSVLVLDTDGDGILDHKTAQNPVPGWIGFRVPGPRGDGARFRALADRFYRQYDRTEGPAAAQLTLLMQELRALALKTSNSDRDLAQALVSALDEGIRDPALGIGALASLGVALKHRGGQAPLVLLLLGEALEAGRLNEEAQAAYDRLLELDPKSTIGAFKKARVTPEGLARFRSSHPEFWSLRQERSY